MGIRSLVLAAIRHVGGLLLGGAVLGYVVAFSMPHGGRAIVHVMTGGVEVTVDDEKFYIESMTDGPIVCDLSPGRHTLRMTRGGRLLYEEEFDLDAKLDTVLAAWEDPARLKGGDIGWQPASDAGPPPGPSVAMPVFDRPR